MKLALAFLVYLTLIVVLCCGVFLLVTGKPWLFIAAFFIYLVAFSKIGCLSEHN